MKKYLINGAMALIVGGFIVSCSHDDISQPATVDQMTKSFDEMFTELYGPIAPNHNWGFETVAAEPGEEQLEAAEEERAATRSAERAATRTPDEFKWEISSGYDATFNNQYYVDVLNLLPEEKDAASKLNNFEFVSRGPFEFSIIYSQTSGHDEIGYYYYNPNGENNNITRVAFVADIQNLSNYVQITQNGNNWSSRAKVFTVNIPAGYRVGFYVKQGDNPIMYSNQEFNSDSDIRTKGHRYYSAIVNKGGEAYLLGLEDWFFRYNDHIADCNDVIMAISKRTDTPPTVVDVDDPDDPDPIKTPAYKEDYTFQKDTYMVIKDQGRVFCEDIATANMGVKEDIDYNDIVFDARVWRVYDKEVTTANSAIIAKTETGERNVRYQYDISLLATGGTIEEKVNGVDVHNKFGVGQAFIVNTWTPNCVSSLSGQWNTPTNVITPKDFSYTLSYNEVDESNIGISTIPIEVKYGGNNMKALNNRETNSEGKSTAPYKLCLPLGTLWPIERVNIDQAYDFKSYVNSPDNKFYTSIKKSENLYKNAPTSSIQDGKEKGATVKIEGTKTKSSWWVVWTGEVTEYKTIDLYDYNFAGGQTLRFFGKGILNVAYGSGSTDRIISEGNLNEDGYIDVKINNAQASLLSQGLLISGSNFKLTKIVVF
jgi:hypothetical protein